MNNVTLIGRLTKDATVRYTTGDKPMAIARFTLAVDREGKKDEADFISCVAFGKTAEFVEKYVNKGRLIGIVGHIQTGSYEKDGKKVYTTDVIADRIQGLEAKKVNDEPVKEDVPATPEGFERLTDDDIPF